MTGGLQRWGLGHLTLRKKILFLMVVVTIGIIAATLLVVNVVAVRQTEATLRNDLDKTRILFENSQKMRMKEIAAEIQLIGEIPFLKALISTGDRATVFGFAKELGDQIKTDLILITDANGRVLAGTDERHVDERVENQPLIQSALRGGGAAGVLGLQGTLYQAVSAPIRLGESLLGTMTLGYRVDDLLAREIKAMTDSEISFIVGDQVIASTWAGREAKILRDGLQAIQSRIHEVSEGGKAGAPFDFDVGGSHVSVLVPLAAGGGQGAILIQRSRGEVARFLDTIRKTVFLVSLLILAAAAWFSYIVAKQISGPVQAIAESSKAMADGDFSISVAVDQRDEVGMLARTFNEMARGLGTLIAQVRENMASVSGITQKLGDTSEGMTREIGRQENAVEETSSSIQEMSYSIKEVNGNVQSLAVAASDTSSSILEMDGSIREVVSHMDELAGAIKVTSSSVSEMTTNINAVARNLETLDGVTENTAASLQDLNASVHQVGQNAQRSYELSENTAQGAQRGMTAVHETISGMEDIQSGFAQLQEIVVHLAQKSESIDQVVKVIEEVAGQTNLLSLNAAIIAAQAGEHGKGFAVVAQEIKDLADRTAASSREIATLITGVQGETSNAVQAMSRGTERVRRGVALSNEAGEVLKAIIESSRGSTQMVQEIVRATQAQSDGLKKVDQSMIQVKDMVRHINQAIHEQDKASGEIRHAVENMRSLGQRVKHSTEEQRKGSQLITGAVQKVTEMVNHILKATQEQRKGSDRITRALEIFKGATEASVQRTAELNNVVAELSTRSLQLEREIGRFKI